MKLQQFTKIAALALGTAYLLSPELANAQSVAIGIAKRPTEAFHEMVYYNLVSKSSVSVGTIPNLKWLSTGTVDIDYLAGYGVMLGGATENYSLYSDLFMVSRMRGVSYQLKITGFDPTQDIIVQKALLQPMSGQFVAIAWNRTRSVNELYSLNLNLGAGVVVAHLLGTLLAPENDDISFFMSYSLEGAKIASDGKLYLLGLFYDQTSNRTEFRIVSHNIATHETTVGGNLNRNSISGALTFYMSSWVCDDGLGGPPNIYLLAYNYPALGYAIYSAGSDFSTASQVASLPQLQNIEPSISCDGQNLRVLGKADQNHANADLFLTYNTALNATSTMSLLADPWALYSISPVANFVGIYPAAMTEPAGNSSRKAVKVKKPKKLKMISAKEIQKCAKKKKTQPYLHGAVNLLHGGQVFDMIDFGSCKIRR